MQSILRFLPFLSLFLDLLSNSFSVSSWLNPLSCSSCVQKLLLMLFFPELKAYLYSNEMSLINYLGSGISHIIFSVVFIAFSAMSLYFTSRLILEAFILARALRPMMKSENIYRFPIGNALLADAVQKNKVKIFTSEKVTIPMATYSKAIFIPKELEKLPQEEFEAIISHELEHVLWRDPILRLFAHLIAAIFWWVPSSSWLKKLEFDQEVSCDQSILKYGFKKEFLAAALIKVAMTARKEAYEALCYLSNKRHPALRRVQIMLDLVSTHSTRYEWVSCVVVGIVVIIGIICALHQ